MKKLFLFILLFLNIFIFIGCDKEDVSSLPVTPTPEEPDVPTPEVTPEPTPDIPVVDSDAIKVSCQEANEIGSNLKANESTSEEYQLTGVVMKVENTKYGNLYISDDGGVNTFYLYGLYDGEVRYDGMINQPQTGDTIIVEGCISNYNGTIIEIKNAQLKGLVKESIEYNNDKVNFIMINDTHGAFIDDETPGIGRVSSVIDELTELNGEYIKIANGDIFQGSYVSNVLYGRPLIDSLNKMKFDCFVLGNHEFDWGIEKIAEYKDGNEENGEADFPFLGANIVYKETGEMLEWLEPYTIVNYGDVKVGIIGIIGHTQESSILTENVKDYDFVYPTNIVSNYAEELRNEKDCDIVVVSIHDYDSEVNYDLSRLSGDSRIDGIFCGHTHTKINDSVTRKDGKSIFVIQGDDKSDSISEAKIFIDDNNQYESFETRHYNPFGYEVDKDIQLIIDNYQDEIDEGNRSLGNTTFYLNKEMLGLLATDAMKDYFEADISIVNTGGIRATIDAGDINIKDVYNVFPFNNEVFIVDLIGSEIISLYYNDGNYLYLNEEFRVNNIDSNKIYKIAVIDYVFTSPYYEEFYGVEFIDTDVLLRDLLIDYLDKMF